MVNGDGEVIAFVDDNGDPVSQERFDEVRSARISTAWTVDDLKPVEEACDE